MKTITTNQIEAVMAELFRCNIPVVSYDRIQKTFDGLPLHKTEGSPSETLEANENSDEEG